MPPAAIDLLPPATTGLVGSRGIERKPGRSAKAVRADLVQNLALGLQYPLTDPLPPLPGADLFFGRIAILGHENVTTSRPLALQAFLGERLMPLVRVTCIQDAALPTRHRIEAVVGATTDPNIPGLVVTYAAASLGPIRRHTIAVGAVRW